MQNILFFGGNRYFGKKLLDLLSINKFRIWVVNRGNIKTKNNPNIFYIRCDRNNLEQLVKKLKNKKFDFIFDNIAYDIKFVRPLLKRLKDKFKHYIFSSSAMCYFDNGFKKKNNENTKIKNNITFLKKFYQNYEILYAKKKRKIENFLEKSKYNYTILRIHNVIGCNDFSKRTFHLLKFNTYKKEYLQKKIQFCYDTDLIKIIFKIFKKKDYFKKNIYNIANNEISFRKILKLIQNVSKGKDKINFPLPVGNIMNNSKIKKYLNFKFTNSEVVIKRLKKSLIA